MRIHTSVALLAHLSLAGLLLAGCSTAPVSMRAPQAAQILETALPATVPPERVVPLREQAMPAERFANGLTRIRIARARADVARLRLVLADGLSEAGPDRRRHMFALNETGSETTLSAWQAALAASGLQAEVWATQHSTVLELSGPDEQLPQMQSLLLRWLRPPPWSEAVLRQADLDVGIQKLMEGFGGSDGQRLWNRLAYGDAHPYARAAETSDTPPSRLHADWLNRLRPASTALLVMASAQALATLPNPEWPLGPSPVTSTPPVNTHATSIPSLPPPQPGLHLHLLHRPGAPQVQILLGDVWTPPPDAEAALSEQILIDASQTLLGSGIGGRLWADLRETQGLAYSLGASNIKTLQAHGLQLQASGAPEKTAALLHGLLEHRALLQQRSASALEMQIVRAQRQGQRARRSDDSAAMLNQAAELWRAGRTAGALERANAQFEQLEAEHLRAFAQQRLGAAPVIVLRGDARQLLQGLRQWFPEAVITEH